MAEPSSDELATTIAELATPLAQQRDVELLDVHVKGPRNRRVVKLIADSDDGLDIDVIASLSREVASVLDDGDVVPGSYTLEVSSPGVDRPLTTERDFRRNLGRDVRVTRRDPKDEARTTEVTGRCHEVADGTVTINVKGRMVDIALEDIVSGKVVLPW